MRRKTESVLMGGQNIKKKKIITPEQVWDSQTGYTSYTLFVHFVHKKNTFANLVKKPWVVLQYRVQEWRWYASMNWGHLLEQCHFNYTTQDDKCLLIFMQWEAQNAGKHLIKMQQWWWNELTRGFLCCAISRDNVSQANSLNMTTDAIRGKRCQAVFV